MGHRVDCVILLGSVVPYDYHEQVPGTRLSMTISSLIQSWPLGGEWNKNSVPGHVSPMNYFSYKLLTYFIVLLPFLLPFLSSSRESISLDSSIIYRSQDHTDREGKESTLQLTSVIEALRVKHQLFWLKCGIPSSSRLKGWVERDGGLETRIWRMWCL